MENSQGSDQEWAIMAACDECVHGTSVREREYHCKHPLYPKGKVIYRETFGVLKKLGCGGAERRV